MDFKTNIAKFGIKSVYLNILGIILSGLLFPILSTMFFPQPQWVSPELFIKSFHPIQTATFFCGYFLITGSLLTFISLYLKCDDNKKVFMFSALLINVIFSVIVFLNYIIQTTYIPYLAMNNPVETNTILPALTMSKAGSLAWALEMYGWGGIGLSFIMASPIFGNTKIETYLKYLFIINGICSVSAAIMTSINMNWIFSFAGFASLIIWNVLVLIIDILLLRYFKQF